MDYLASRMVINKCKLCGDVWNSNNYSVVCDEHDPLEEMEKIIIWRHTYADGEIRAKIKESDLELFESLLERVEEFQFIGADGAEDVDGNAIYYVSFIV